MRRKSPHSRGYNVLSRSKRIYRVFITTPLKYG
jgi:hypothetical protein